MNETKSQLIDVEQEISAALSDGAHINEDQLNRLMDAYGRHNAKNDKIYYNYTFSSIHLRSGTTDITYPSFSIVSS